MYLDYNPREYIHDSIQGIITGTEGYFIDFDNNRLGALSADSTINIEIDYNNQLLKAKYHEDLQMTFSTMNNDSVEIDMGENVMHVFRKLNLNHRIRLTEEEIVQFISRNCIDSIQGYKLEFTDEIFYRDSIKNKLDARKILWNHNWEDFGVWFVDKYLENAFLVFTIGQMEKKNIFQIISISDNEIEIDHLQGDRQLENVTKLTTCQ